MERNGSLVKIDTFKAVCFLRISFDLNITAAIQIVTKKPKSLQKEKDNKLKGLFKLIYSGKAKEMQSSLHCSNLEPKT